MDFTMEDIQPGGIPTELHLLNDFRVHGRVLSKMVGTEPALILLLLEAFERHPHIKMLVMKALEAHKNDKVRSSLQKIVKKKSENRDN